MNTLKVKVTIGCAVCGCALRRYKAIKVSAENKADAIKEANEKAQEWKKSLKGKTCKICTSILQSVNK